MVEITAGLVKDLRTKTGAGMMDCKKALVESGGDIEAAVDWLRTKGLAAAAKKAGRIAAEGLIGVHSGGAVGAIVEVNSETDFVARNETFQSFVHTVSELACVANADAGALLTAPYPGSALSVEGKLKELVATIGENMAVRRAQALSVGAGVVAGYVHNTIAPGMGKIGVLVALESTGDKEKLAELGKNIAMHVAAANPQALAIDAVDATALERERAVLREQATASGRPPEVIEKMVEGRLRKFYEETVLLEQVYVIDGKERVGKVVDAAAKDIGAPVRLTGFVRYALGEGIERDEADFAAEVAETLAG